MLICVNPGLHFSKFKCEFRKILFSKQTDHFVQIEMQAGSANVF